MKILNYIENHVFKFLSGLSIIALLSILFLILINIFGRYFELYTLSWINEDIEIIFSWMVFMGAAALWMKHDHFRVDYLSKKLAHTKLGWLLEAFIVSSCLFFLVILTWQGFMLTVKAGAITPILEIPTFVSYASIPLSGLIMSLYSMRDLHALFTGGENGSEALVIDDV